MLQAGFQPVSPSLARQAEVNATKSANVTLLSPVMSAPFPHPVGLAQVGAQDPTKRLITGCVIVAAVVLDQYRRRVR